MPKNNQRHLTQAIKIALGLLLLYLAFRRVDWDVLLDTLQTVSAFWLVMAYFTVVRFLSYLDQRIRAEGWEVELLLRAERARLESQMA